MKEKDRLTAFQEILGYRFANPRLLSEALTHASAKGEGVPSYERLEFFGDAVLGLVISEALFHRFPEEDEGNLTGRKSDLVSHPALVKLARDLQITRFLTIGKGLPKKALPPSIAADAVEAVIGAVYLDEGLTAARQLVLRLYGNDLSEAVRGADNAKSRLQEVTQKRFGEAPTYALLDEEGPEHRKTFRVSCVISTRELGRGSGRTKKEAEQDAAAAALARLDAGPRPQKPHA